MNTRADNDKVEKRIVEALHGRIKNIIEEEAAAAGKRVEQNVLISMTTEARRAGENIEKRVREDTVNLSLSLLNSFALARVGEELVIRIDFKNTQL